MKIKLGHRKISYKLAVYSFIFAVLLGLIFGFTIFITSLLLIKLIFIPYYLIKLRKYKINTNKLANPHTIITGSSGYGKTTLCKEIISQVDRPTLILDVHNEYSECVDKVINPLETSVNLWDEPKETISILQRTMNLGSVQIYYLEQIIKKLSGNGQKISNRAILEELRKQIEEQKGQKKAIYVGIYRRLSKLEDVFSGKKEINFKHLINSKASIDLSKIKDESIQLVYSELLLRKIYGTLTQNK